MADGGRLPQNARPAHLLAFVVHTVFSNPGAAADTRSKQKSTAARFHEAAVLWFVSLSVRTTPGYAGECKEII